VQISVEDISPKSELLPSIKVQRCPTSLAASRNGLEGAKRLYLSIAFLLCCPWPL